MCRYDETRQADRGAGPLESAAASIWRRSSRRRSLPDGDRRRFSPRTSRIDETHAAPAPTMCPDRGGAVALDRVEAQYQEDLPACAPSCGASTSRWVTASQCRRRVQGRHPLQTSDALGAAAAQLGPNIAALVVELHTELGMPLEKVTRVLRNEFGLQAQLLPKNNLKRHEAALGRRARRGPAGSGGRGRRRPSRTGRLSSRPPGSSSRGGR